MKLSYGTGIVSAGSFLGGFIWSYIVLPEGPPWVAGLAASILGGAATFCLVARQSRTTAQEVETTRISSEQTLEGNRKSLESLATALRSSEASNQQKARFLASMSHELRTPIGAILGYAEVLEGEKGSMADQQQALSSIRRNGEHVLELVNDVLDLSKIEAGKLEIEVVEFTLEKVLKDVLSVMSARAQGKGIRLDEVYLNMIPARIVSDPTRVRQVLINLVSNAVKFTERGLVTLGVSHTSLDSRDSRLEFRVQDTGIGIAREKVDRLFRPFQQVHSESTRKYGGTGLGLAISKEIAKLLGGDIEVASDPGLGSLFTFSIRCKLAEGTPMLRRPSSAVLDDSKRFPVPGASGTAPTKLSGRVLVVDDSPDNRKLFRYHLQNAGVGVELAENGSEGITRATAQSFDVILMDIQMPEVDGFGALKEIRAQGVKTPVVALTAHAMKGDRERCLSAGFNDYLSKPVSRSALLAKVGEFMGGQKPTPVPNADATTLEEIVAEFRATLPAKADALARAREAGELTTARLIVHSLKGTAGGMGLESLAAIVLHAYNTLQGSDDPGVLSVTEGLEQACRAEAVATQTMVAAEI